MVELGEIMPSFQAGYKSLGRPPWSKRMAAGWTNPDLEHVKYGNGFVWQGMTFWAKLGKNLTLQASGFTSYVQPDITFLTSLLFLLC
jgi:hypothetical protein